MKFFRRVASILRFIGTAFLFLYICIELPLRVYDLYTGTTTGTYGSTQEDAANTNNHPILEYTARTNIHGTGTFIEPGKNYTVKTNSFGFRTHEFYPKQKGEYRILLLGDSFTFGWNANENETFAAVLEQYLQRNISNKIHVYSLGIAGYSPLKYVLLLKLYAATIRPDLIIVSIDQSDFNEDLISSERYEFDEQGIPTQPKDTENILSSLGTNVRAIGIKGDLIAEHTQFNTAPIMQAFSTVRYAKKLYEHIRRTLYEVKIPIIEKTYDQHQSRIVSYKQLVQKNGTNLLDHLPDRLLSDFIPYDVQTALHTYKPTIRFLSTIKELGDTADSDLIFSVYPYPWMVSTHEAVPYQDSVFNHTVYDMRSNRVHPQLVESISHELDVEFIDAYPFFESLPSGYYGKYDPHFSAKGYERYATFLYESIKDRIENTIRNK